MGIKNKLSIRGPFMIGLLTILMSTLACAGLLVPPSDIPPPGSTDIDDDVIKMVDENGDWIPLAGEATFELIGELEDKTPWKVTGQITYINEMTQIEDGLQVGHLVYTRGAILRDGTWLAYSIEPAEEQIEPGIILNGRMTSLIPWVVDGIELNVTDETEFNGDIRRGMLVRVENLLLPDGTREVKSISPLGDFIEVEDCVTVVARTVNVNGNQIQLLGWPLVRLGEELKIADGTSENDDKDTEQDEEDDSGDDDQVKDEDKDENDDSEEDGGMLSPNQNVQLVICPSGDDRIKITQIIVLD